MKNPTHYIIITDCFDSSTAGRQKVRAQSLFKGISPVLIESSYKHAVSLAGNIIDILGTLEYDTESKALIIGNHAPREVGKRDNLLNGSPFVYFWYKEHLFVVTYTDELFAILRKYIDIPVVYEVTDELKAKIAEVYPIDFAKTQFRSLDYAPFLGKYIWDHPETVGKEIVLTDEADVLAWSVWHTDNFGNVKLLATRSDLDGATRTIEGIGEVTFYERLKDVPVGETAIIQGSSGVGDSRFLELVIQGGSAAGTHGISVGDIL